MNHHNRERRKKNEPTSSRRRLKPESKPKAWPEPMPSNCCYFWQAFQIITPSSDRPCSHRMFLPSVPRSPMNLTTTKFPLSGWVSSSPMNAFTMSNTSSRPTEALHSTVGRFVRVLTTSQRNGIRSTFVPMANFSTLPHLTNRLPCFRFRTFGLLMFPLPTSTRRRVR
jgi:hypothetical protein